MGDIYSTQQGSTQSEQILFVEMLDYKLFRERSNLYKPFVVYEFRVGFQRYHWKIKKRFKEVFALHSHFQLWKPLDDGTLVERGACIAKYLESISQHTDILMSTVFWEFFEVGKSCFKAELGRKGKAGYLKKCSGGYNVPRNKDIFMSWKWRWVVAHDTFISYHKSHNHVDIIGVIPIDPGFRVLSTGRYLRIHTYSRDLTLFAPTSRIASEWEESLTEFYKISPRVVNCPTGCGYPCRECTECVDIFLCSKDYFFSLAQSLLGATHEIFITCCSHDPHLILTRPPMPPVSLQEIIKYKALHGVKIYILLSPEDTGAEYAKRFYELQSPNIVCLYFCGAPSGREIAHCEKLVVVDRSTAFIGTTDLALGRFDDSKYEITDVDGTLYPGADYVIHPYRERMHSCVAQDQESVVSDARHTDERFSIIHRLPTMDISIRPVAVVSGEDDVDFEAPSDKLCVKNNESSDSGNVEITDAELYTRHTEYRDEGFDEPETKQETGVREEAESLCPTTEAVPFREMTVLSTEKETGRTQSTMVVGMLHNIFQSLGPSGGKHKRKIGTRPMEARKVYPRQPWHDTQVKVVGVAARDTASFFIRRWNFTRRYSSDGNCELLGDVTDDQCFSRCSRCNLEGIHDKHISCPQCEYFLGNRNPYMIPSAYTDNRDVLDIDDINGLHISKIPAVPSQYCFIVFECAFESKMGCSICGSGPVAVEFVHDTPIRMGGEKLIHSQGAECNVLKKMGLFPSVGDVILAIDGVSVEHFTATEVREMLGRTLRNLPPGKVFRVILRRHHLRNVVARYASRPSADVSGAARRRTARAVPVRSSSDESEDELMLSKDQLQCFSPAVEEAKHASDALSCSSREEISSLQREMKDCGFSSSNTSLADVPNVGDDLNCVNNLSPGLECSESKLHEDDNAPIAAPINMPTVPQPDSSLSDYDVSPTFIMNRSFPKRHRIDACATACSMSSRFCMSNIFHNVRCRVCSNFVDRILQTSKNTCFSTHRSTSTCKVQVLNNSCQWSMGCRSEVSASTAMIEAIEKSQHLVYIENEIFFGEINSAEHDDTHSRIVASLLRRLVRAAKDREHFRVIVLLPLFPGGNFTRDEVALKNLLKSYWTICRGGHSLLESLHAMCPAVNPTDYICFYCLKSWGVLNGNVVTEQVRLGSGLMIVDDRVMFLGSFGVRDLNLADNVDTELCVRIEDTNTVGVQLGGAIRTVGALPHSVRVSLMASHSGGISIGLASDVFSDMAFHSRNSDDPFTVQWHNVALHNTEMYDYIEGDASVYKCRNLFDFCAALEKYEPVQFHNSERSQDCLASVRGNVLLWPFEFLFDDTC